VVCDHLLVINDNDYVTILCAEGAVMAELAEELLGVKECEFRPSHVNNLANEFRCYANYKTTSLIHMNHNNG